MKVFVSYCSRDNEFVVAMTQALDKGLDDSWDVLIDKTGLELGDEWRPEIYHWLGECDAAVVVLSKDALDANWVRREVNILLWRRALGYPLRIISVIIDNLSRERLSKSGIGDLAEFQFARLEIRAGAKVEVAAAEVADQIVARLGGMAADDRHDSPMAVWIDAVEDGLRQVRNPDSLAAAVRELQVAEAQVSRVRDPLTGCRFLAHQMLGRWQPHGLCQAMAKIAHFTPHESMRRLVNNIASSWVDVEASRGLLGVGRSERGMAILNAKNHATAHLYVDRATCVSQTGFKVATVKSVTGESFLEEFEIECEKAVMDLLGLVPPFTLEEYLSPDGSLPAHEDGQLPDDIMFIVVRPDDRPLKLVAEGIRAVHKRFPWLVFILLSGHALPTDEELAVWGLPDARRLEPALGPREEMDAWRAINELGQICKRASGRLALEEI